MIKIFYLIIVAAPAIYGQENAIRIIPSSLRECYDNKYLLQRDNRYPHTLQSLIAIIQKIENIEGLNMDLRSLSVALLHRFRQDGIQQNPTVPLQDGVTPFAPFGFQFFRHAQVLRLIPGNAMLFPNDSITDVERCTLHFMMSSGIEIFKTEDEETVCRFANGAYRSIRSASQNIENSSGNEDAETLSPEEMIMKSEDATKNAIDPHSLYPEFPPNHPERAKMSLPPLSKCPVENGVIKTPWGAVSFGSVLAGIAAALHPQRVFVSELLRDKSVTYTSDVTIDSKALATLAGDLAEAALMQGPKGEKYQIGADGDWNSTVMQRWYFLKSNESLSFTTAEIRGDIDGLILANEVDRLYKSIPNLKLSQILDMYYNGPGFFNSAVRACNRRVLFRSVAPNNTLSAQAYSAILVLQDNLAKATLDLPVMEKFAVEAANNLSMYIPSSMNKDLSCAETDWKNDFTKIFVDLTIILDTTWPFKSIQSIIARLVENVEINPFNSNFTILNGHDGTTMINSSNSILHFYGYNSSHYNNISHGFNLPISLTKLSRLQDYKLNNERNQNIAAEKSNVVLIIPYNTQIASFDKEYCLEEIKKMSENAPDVTILILTFGSKDVWSQLVRNPETDLFSINLGTTEEALKPLEKLISRIKQVPKRLINTQCGADYLPQKQSNSYIDYIEPFGNNFYRLHPNYFFSLDDAHVSKIKIQGSESTSLTVCSSRNLLYGNVTEGKTCTAIQGGSTHDVEVSCNGAGLIHKCKPLYISVTSNSSDFLPQCTDSRFCRYPYMMKYTISFENLVCTSATNNIIFNPIMLIIAFIYFYL